MLSKTDPASTPPENALRPRVPAHTPNARAPYGSAYREYVLSETGRGLFLIIVALRQWGEDYLYRPDERRSELIGAATGHPVARLELRSAEGRVLAWDETRVSKARRD